MKFGRSVAIGAVLVGLAVMGLLITRGRRAHDPAGTAASVRLGNEPGVNERDVRDFARPEGGLRRPSSESRRRADALRERIRELRSEKAKLAGDQAEAQTKSAKRMPAPVGSANQTAQALGKYVKDTVREQFLPMAKGCYEELLLRQPDAGGKLVLDVVVGGDTSVGGVVESVGVAPESTINDASTVTCMVESMMALVFDAPPEGHDRIDFKYPFVFSPDAPDAQSANRGDP